MSRTLKGVILAGGLGTRLMPLTNITNKHLLPVYDKPMIYYPIEQMVKAGIKDIILVTGGPHAGHFLRILGDGSQFGLRSLNYTYQDGEGGIAQALGLVKKLVGDNPMAVLLGDNIFENNIRPQVEKFQKNPHGAMISIKKVSDPERFGVVEINNGKVTRIVEKPRSPKSKFAVAGLYFYDSHVFDIIATLKPSKRGELEITDVNSAYIKKGQLACHQIKGWWSDCGTFESLYKTSVRVEKKGFNN